MEVARRGLMFGPGGHNEKGTALDKIFTIPTFEQICFDETIKESVITHIKNSDYALGAFGWMGEWGVIDALAELPNGCNLILSDRGDANNTTKGKIAALSPHTFTHDPIVYLPSGEIGMMHDKFLLLGNCDSGTCSPYLVGHGSWNATYTATFNREHWHWQAHPTIVDIYKGRFIDLLGEVG